MLSLLELRCRTHDLTFSIIARDPTSGALGVAIASRFFAVGAICPFVFPGLGAFSTQASGHPPFGAEAERLLLGGVVPEQVLAQLIATDTDRHKRQLHLIDASGRIAAHNGSEIIAAAGHRAASNVSVAGNMLADESVLDAAVEAFISSRAPLTDRLLLALEAAHSAGGDNRGQQAASLIIYGAQPVPLISLRVDDDPDAVAALRRLREGAEADYIPYMRRFATLAEIAGVFGA